MCCTVDKKCKEKEAMMEKTNKKQRHKKGGDLILELRKVTEPPSQCAGEERHRREL